MNNTPTQLTKEEADVTAFMTCAQQATPPKPVMPDLGVRRLRVTLIAEELLELSSAYGLHLTIKDGVVQLEESLLPTDLVEAYDAVLDLQVVVVGTAVAQGTRMAPGWDAVHASNMAKFGPGGHRRPDGKWVKPPDWKAPDLGAILKQQEGA